MCTGMLDVGKLIFMSIYLNSSGGNMKTLVLNFSHIFRTGPAIIHRYFHMWQSVVKCVQLYFLLSILMYCVVSDINTSNKFKYSIPWNTEYFYFLINIDFFKFCNFSLEVLRPCRWCPASLHFVSLYLHTGKSITKKIKRYSCDHIIDHYETTHISMLNK